jgi:NAD(P)H-dependent FMN reductase
LISAPEYNSSITAVLKNTIDWVSRPVPGEAPLACFDGKVASLMSASPGALGGLRGLVHVRAILGNIKVLVLPDQVAISRAGEAFNPDGSLKDPKQQAAVEGLGAQLAWVIAKLHA